MEGKDDNTSGPMERAGMHGPDSLLGGKHLYPFEAQLREELEGHTAKGIAKAEQEGVIAKLRRKLSDSMGWGGPATNNPPLEVGEVGYGDPASELHENMKAAMEEAAEAVREGAAHAKKVVMEQDLPHVHAPELFHPEQVMSMADARRTEQYQTSNVSVKESVDAAVATLNNMAEDAREGIGEMVKSMVAEEGVGNAEEGDNDVVNEALEVMLYGPE